MSQTIIPSSGGTGGHIFPALSLAEELSDLCFHCAVPWSWVEFVREYKNILNNV